MRVDVTYDPSRVVTNKGVCPSGEAAEFYITQNKPFMSSGNDPTHVPIISGMASKVFSILFRHHASFALLSATENGFPTYSRALRVLTKRIRYVPYF